MTSHRTVAKFALVIFVVASTGQMVTAQNAARRVQWEYCAITGIDAPLIPNLVDSKITATASICYFQADGCRREEVKFEASVTDITRDIDPRDRTGGAGTWLARDKIARAALSNAIAKLGANGWEMVGQAVFIQDGTLGNSAIYFKRRK